MEDLGAAQEHHAHRKAHAGAKAEKKLLKKQAERQRSSNPKAFAITKINKVRKAVAHTLDKYVPPGDGGGVAAWRDGGI